MQKRPNQRALNKAMEAHALLGTKTQRRKKYKEIIKELGQRNITFQDIANDISDSPKYKGFLDMLKSTPGFTFDDVVILQQYARAITDGDTKAATFLRDTVIGPNRSRRMGGACGKAHGLPAGAHGGGEDRAGRAHARIRGEARPGGQAQAPCRRTGH